MPTLHVVVHGRVQGVGFRWFAMKRARELGLTGWVRNLEDGSVEAWAEGSADALARLLEAVKLGPVGSQVTRVDADRPEREQGFDAFEVR